MLFLGTLYTLPIICKAEEFRGEEMLESTRQQKYQQSAAIVEC